MKMQDYLDKINRGGDVLLNASVDPEISDEQYSELATATRRRYDAAHAQPPEAV